MATNRKMQYEAMRTWVALELVGISLLLMVHTMAMGKGGRQREFHNKGNWLCSMTIRWLNGLFMGAQSISCVTTIVSQDQFYPLRYHSRGSTGLEDNKHSHIVSLGKPGTQLFYVFTANGNSFVPPVLTPQLQPRSKDPRAQFD